MEWRREGYAGAGESAVADTKGTIMTGTHICQFCGKPMRIEHRRGRVAEYCSPHCANARKYLNAFTREMAHVDLGACGPSVRSELFMIANTVVKARNCRAGAERRRELQPA